MNALDPHGFGLDTSQSYDVLMARVCERLHCLPDQARSIAYPDLCVLLEVWRADEAIAKIQAKKRG